MRQQPDCGVGGERFEQRGRAVGAAVVDDEDVTDRQRGPNLDEDRLDVLSIAADGQVPVQLKAVKPCARCPIPNIDPATAQSSPEVGDMLQSYRKNDIVKGAPSFGMTWALSRSMALA